MTSANEMVSETLKKILVGDPVSRGPLHLFPLSGGSPADDGIMLLDEALESGGSLGVEELDGGSVPELRVINEGERAVLILEGDEFVGFKQNRVVNSSVLVAAGSRLVLPVSCVEQGRWSRRSRPFSSGDASPHLSLRRKTSRSVHDSLKSGRGHRSDQGAVWREVDRLAEYHAAPSSTRALQDTRSRLREKLSAFEDLAKRMPEDARAVIVALGGRPVSLEILAGPRLFSKVFPKLLRGYALEALEHERSETPPDPFSARDLVESAASAKREEHPAVGAGRDFRFESGEVSGYALTSDSGLLHAAIFADGFAAEE